MTAKKPFGLPSLKLVLIAAVAGVVAGAAAVYVKQAGSGNGTTETAAAGDCQPAKAKGAALTPFTKGQVAAMVGAQQPLSLQGVAFKGTDGQPLSVANFAGKTVLLNLWATWCVPCREEMPALNALQKQMGNDKFEVVAVNIDTGDDEKPKTFRSDNGIDTLGYYRDNSMGVFNALKKQGLAFGLPVTLLLDGKGCLVSAMNGPAAWDSEDAKGLIKAATAL
ncbi:MULTISPECIES: thiol:disulfide interchange protein TlpA [unclassified Rhizobium]|uniref:thiol:disulfide interchange protein TlpA n=1 Tax=unclassified Rhizobium TaxID=2613769 RepID=UPI001ADB81B6|nr:MULTISPECIES: TlpA disulfide reductase family protein [unclassified Rhizobium]MBO9100037.1 TlpA family protein disulfide reductase [Rhizobium sp. L58/93]MBO9135807.1 TlpA family protein disulfide reductase [Rhizobium sp. B209b/85]MBO9169978.1 TlpA family protein disulfide reductase [Rhizobium sp. L245/93]MBO9185930.1 TlpA family protein disulfide reductase [Rhizobium sp. E27B/91]QXZ82866.1 TlpA family protein disulfide reductase [Rhizobium sp. K1/93]